MGRSPVLPGTAFALPQVRATPMDRNYLPRALTQPNTDVLRGRVLAPGNRRRQRLSATRQLTVTCRTSALPRSTDTWLPRWIQLPGFSKMK
jgi:hypothetical protein